MMQGHILSSWPLNHSCSVELKSSPGSWQNLIPFPKAKPGAGRVIYLKSGSEYLIRTTHRSLFELLPQTFAASWVEIKKFQTFLNHTEVVPGPRLCWSLKRQQVWVGLRVFATQCGAFTAGGAVPQQDLLAQADAAGSFPRAGGGGEAGVRPRRLLPDVAGFGSGLQQWGVFVDQVWYRELELGLMFLHVSFSAPVFCVIFFSTYHSIHLAVAPCRLRLSSDFLPVVDLRRCDICWPLFLLLTLLLHLAVPQLLLGDKGRLFRGGEEWGVCCVRRRDHRIRGDHHVLGGLQRSREALLPWRRWWVQPREGVEGGDVTGREERKGGKCMWGWQGEKWVWSEWKIRNVVLKLQREGKCKD